MFSDGPDYILKDWPPGYALFDHHKEQKGADKKIRHDPYLIGAGSPPILTSIAYRSFVI
jgi:hypothetical protein